MSYKRGDEVRSLLDDSTGVVGMPEDCVPGERGFCRDNDCVPVVWGRNKNAFPMSPGDIELATEGWPRG